jgi:TRAP-type C4-dicarboxylate transport system substrate-binding protein
MRRSRIIFLAAVVMVILVQSMDLHALTIKIGTIAPDRSPWVKELKRLGEEWGRITGGEVKIKIYAGSIVGSEEDMVRKIRMGILGGAVFTSIGITNIYPDSYVMAIPFSLNSEAELDHVMDKMAPIFEKGIEDRGFKLIVWAKSGWVYFFTKTPIQYPEDLKKHKLSFTTGASEMEQAWKQSGYHVVPNELKDMMMGLQSGMVDSFYLPPVLAASGQFFELAPNMCPLKIGPLVGGLVVSKRIWDSVPPQYRKEMQDVARKMAANLFQETIKLEQEALDEMKKHGLKINPVPPDALEKWKAASDKGMDALVGKAFSKDIYDTMMHHIKEFRNSHKQ